MNVSTLFYDGQLHCFIERKDIYKLDFEKILQKLRANLINYELPNNLYSIKCLPRNNNNKVDKEFFLYSGFADVTSDKLTVLSDIALEKNEFDLKFEKENLVRLEQEKNKTKDEKESLYIEEKIKKINKMIEMLG